jgi:hypothetical protein
MQRNEERRKSRRIAIDFFVAELIDDRTYLHPAINLSTEGLYILAHDDRRAIDGDQVIGVEFTLPTGYALRVRGRVVHVDDRRGQRGIGIEFVDLEASDQDAIDAYISDEELGRAANG